MTQVGLVGLGKMGAAIASRLLDTGHELIVWNRSPTRTREIVERGARAVRSPSEVAEAAEVVIVIVRDDDASLEVFTGANGLLSVPVEGKLFIEMSTIRPATAIGIARRCREKGAGYLDSPVSGTVGPAKEGKLLALVGGDEADLSRARPTLEKLTRRIVHAGPVGRGALLKLVVNLPLLVYWQALAEAVAMGRAGGLDLELILDTIQDSPAALAALGIKKAAILDPTANVASDVTSMRKDLKYIVETGSHYGVPMTASAAALATYAAADAAGLAAADAVVVVRFLAEQMTRAASASPDSQREA